MTPPLALQWSLDPTVDSALSIASGIIKAATSDNIQPLALMACEAFGANLAMSQQTCLKMEGLAKRRNNSYVFKHIEARIGYSAGDSADQLASTEAGVRFLGFAAILDTINAGRSLSFTAAQVLHGLLSNFSPNRRQLPTVRQLQDLLLALSRKTSDLGFSENVYGWLKWLRAVQPAVYYEERGDMAGAEYPTCESIQSLVQALAELERIGQAGFAVIDSVCSIASWLIATIKWCTGTPPTVYGMDKKRLWKSNASLITLNLIPHSRSHDTFSIKTYTSFDLKNLLWERSAGFEARLREIVCFVSARVYLRNLIEIYNFQLTHSPKRRFSMISMLIV